MWRVSKNDVLIVSPSSKLRANSITLQGSKHQLQKLFMMVCYMYITIKYLELKTSVVYVHSVALKVKFEERKGDKGFKN